MGNPRPIGITSDEIDLSRRFLETHAVAASPTAGTITTIATLTITSDVVVTKGIFLEAFAAYTVGTNGVSGLLEIRQTNTTGTLIGSTGALTVVATNLVAASVQGIDTGPTLPGQVYVVCLTVGSGSAGSTVSAVSLFATIV